MTILVVVAVAVDFVVVMTTVVMTTVVMTTVRLAAIINVSIMLLFFDGFAVDIANDETIVRRSVERVM